MAECAGRGIGGTGPGRAGVVLLAGSTLLWLAQAWAELPRPRQRSEPPSLELLEFLGEMQDARGEWIEPEFLSGLTLPDSERPAGAGSRDDKDD